MYVGRESEPGRVVNDIHFMVGDTEGVSSFTETHHMGLFDEADYRAAFAAGGLRVIHADPKGFFGNGVYIARR